jgi:hypothetical protein
MFRKKNGLSGYLLLAKTINLTAEQIKFFMSNKRKKAAQITHQPERNS